MEAQLRALLNQHSLRELNDNETIKFSISLTNNIFHLIQHGGPIKGPQYDNASYFKW